MEVVKKRLLELEQEASQLVGYREKLYKIINDTDVRLHQITGAITELTNLFRGELENEGDQDHQPTVSGSPDEVEQPGAAAQVSKEGLKHHSTR